MTITTFTVAIVCLLIGAAFGLFICAVLAGGRIHELQAELRQAKEDCAAMKNQMQLARSQFALEKTLRKWGQLSAQLHDDGVLIPQGSKQAEAVREG